MDRCCDCIFSRERGKLCANPVVITDYEGPGGGTPLSLLTEGVVKTAHLRLFKRPDVPEDSCPGYSERPSHSITFAPDDITYEDGRPIIEPMRDALGVDKSAFYVAGFWIAVLVVIGLVAVIWRLA